MGGRIGEEIETGDFSNGAAMDIKQATRLARHMVCDWGMSDLGPVAYGENREHMFLAREITRTQNYSEDTAQKIDTAIRHIVRGQFDRAKKLIEEHRDALTKISETLLQYETIEGVHVKEIIEHGEIRSPVESNTLIHRKKDQPKANEEKAAEKKEEPEIGPSADAAGAIA